MSPRVDVDIGGPLGAGAGEAGLLGGHAAGATKETGGSTQTVR